ERIARELLDLRSIDLDRGFFEQGGDSIAAVRLVIAIDAALGRRLAMGTVLEHPTLRSLAQRIDEAAAVPVRPVIVLRDGAARPPIWLTAPVHGNALCYLRLASLLGR